MQNLTAQLISQKKVLLRIDLDVPIENGRVVDDLRLEAGLDTLDFCLQHGKSVIIMGHVGRPVGEDLKYSVKPIVDWFEERFADINLSAGKLHILENLRFEAGEDECDPDFAKELASLGDVFINEAFAAHHKASSTTVLPTLLPHAAGFRFAAEVETLLDVKNNPQKPLVVIIGGVKVEDKLPAVLELSKIADAILVGGKVALEMKLRDVNIPANVLLAKLNEQAADIAPETVDSWRVVITQAKQILWNGPLGKIDNGKLTMENLGSAKGTYEVAQMVINSKAKSIVGGGDTLTALDKWGMLDQFSFVSTGGGAMLELLEKGTLETIEALT